MELDPLGELARRREKEKLRYFVPNGKQEETIRLVGEGRHFVVLLSAANGVGKTALMVNVLGNLIWGPQNKYFDYPIFRNYPYPKRIRIGTESNNLKEIGAIDTEIKTWWPEGRYEGLKAGQQYISQYKTDTGWILDKMSYEQETREWESATLGLGLLDEPPPKDKYSALVTRMRKGGLVLISMTPLTNAAWIMDDLVDSHGANVGVVYADMEDNCLEHGVRGILQHAHIENMIEQMDPEEVQARAHGKFMHLSNVILGSAFKREFHVVRNEMKPPAGSQFGMVVDPASGKPWAMAWFWVDPRGQIVFDREYPLDDFTKMKESNMDMKGYSDVIRILDEGLPMEWRIIDRHYANSKDDYGSTLKRQLAERCGLEFMDSYNCEEEIETGIQRVKDRLKFNDRMPVDAVNFPRLVVKERCHNIIRAMERWARDPKTLSPQRDSPYKDHFDLVRYVCGLGPEVYFYRPAPAGRRLYAPGGLR